MVGADQHAGILAWLNTTSVGGFVLGGVVVAIGFVRRSVSRTSLDAAQFDSIKSTLNLLRDELAREREARLADSATWRAREEQLSSELDRVTQELGQARQALSLTKDELARTNEKLVSTNERLKVLQEDFDNIVRERNT